MKFCSWNNSANSSVWSSWSYQHTTCWGTIAWRCQESRCCRIYKCQIVSTMLNCTQDGLWWVLCSISSKKFQPILPSSFILFLESPFGQCQKMLQHVQLLHMHEKMGRECLFFSLSSGLTQINQKISYFSKKISENARKLGGGFVFSHCYLKYGFYGNP